MPRYFFHIKDTGKTMLDQDGIELDDLDGVREKASGRHCFWFLV